MTACQLCESGPAENEHEVFCLNLLKSKADPSATILLCNMLSTVKAIPPYTTYSIMLYHVII